MDTYREVIERGRYVRESYRFWNRHVGSIPSFNARMERFKKRVRSTRCAPVRLGERLHPWLELAITHRWRVDHPEAGWRAPDPAEIAAVCVSLSDTLQPVRGRPAQEVLKHHVAASMALHHWATGRQVTASKTKNSLYDPHLTGTAGLALRQLWAHIDPTVSETTLVNIVLELSRRGSPVELGFETLLPGYDSRIDPETGAPILGPNMRVESFGVIHPIYCS